MFLTAAELFDLTKKRRPSAQARVLKFLDIPFKRRPDGTLVVLRVHAGDVSVIGGMADNRKSGPNWEALHGAS